MFRRNGNVITRAVLIALVFALIPMLVASAADNRPTGPTIINTDGSTTLFPILQLAAEQFPTTALGAGVTIVNDTPPGTGSGHGIRSLANQLPIQGTTIPIDIGLSSSACGTNGTRRVTATTFTEGSYTDVAPVTQTTLQCADFTAITVAKDAITILVNQAQVACINASARPYITRNGVISIWEGRSYNSGTDVIGPVTEAGTVTHTWNQYFSACGTETMTPRSRIITSGTHTSFGDLTGVQIACTEPCDSREELGINATGLGRLQGNVGLEAAIAANQFQIAYTGKAFDNAQTAQISVQDLTKVVGSQGPALPTDANVATNAYPWSRAIYAYYLTSQTKQAVRDLETYLYSSAMQGNIEKLDYVSIWRSTVPSVPAAQEPAPAWDVDANRTGNIIDVTTIGSYFGQTGPASGDPNFPNLRGWTRADVNFDAAVNILDITTFGPRFGSSW